MVRFTLSLCLAMVLSMPATAQEGSRKITGALIYMQKIALPEEAEVHVMVMGALDTTLGESRFETSGAQVPLPFEVTVPERLSGTFRALIRVDGRPAWRADDLRIAAGPEDVDLGDVRLRQFTPLAFASRFDCGGTTVEFGMQDDTPTLRLEGRDYWMRPVPAASGSRYVAEADETVTFWSKGTEAMLTVGGEERPACAKVEKDPETYTARGNEPGWSVVIGEAEAEVVANSGDTRLVTARPEIRPEPGAYVLDMPEIDARLRLEERLCRDDATGMPYPHRAVMTLGGRDLHGCGGDAASLLTDGEWTIAEVDGAPVIDESGARIIFDESGRLSGRTGCNGFTGSYFLTGEGLNLGQMGSTMMACPGPLMKQERLILDALEQVARFEIDESGALRLVGGDGQVLLIARRA